ncbi:MAG: hypothetical protein M3Q07_09605 [Pseudobdellovibrionaceae bacterium]|nr:hypothetical protein [Pseudobdellovibrionaceae bacterium]
MKWFLDRSLRVRMLLSTFVSLLTTSLICTALGGFQIADLSMTASKAQAQLELAATSAEIQNQINAPFDLIRTMALNLQVFREQNRMPLTRQDVMDMMRVLVEKNPDVLGIWTTWEPNAFDGQDQKFAHAPVHDASGRFAPYAVNITSAMNELDVATHLNSDMAHETMGFSSSLGEEAEKLNLAVQQLTMVVMGRGAAKQSGPVPSKVLPLKKNNEDADDFEDEDEAPLDRAS